MSQASLLALCRYAGSGPVLILPCLDDFDMQQIALIAGLPWSLCVASDVERMETREPIMNFETLPSS